MSKSHISVFSYKRFSCLTYFTKEQLKQQNPVYMHDKAHLCVFVMWVYDRGSKTIIHCPLRNRSQKFTFILNTKVSYGRFLFIYSQTNECSLIRHVCRKVFPPLCKAPLTLMSGQHTEWDINAQRNKHSVPQLFHKTSDFTPCFHCRWHLATSALAKEKFQNYSNRLHTAHLKNLTTKKYCTVLLYNCQYTQHYYQ